jgi:5-methylcytosine-specific restriction endonuclease McrA
MAKPAYRSAAYQRNRALLLADGAACHWCGGAATTADHVVPIAHGGGPGLDNLVPSCSRCNSRRGGRLGYAAMMRRVIDGERRPRRRPAIGFAHGEPL